MSLPDTAHLVFIFIVSHCFIYLVLLKIVPKKPSCSIPSPNTHRHPTPNYKEMEERKGRGEMEVSVSVILHGFSSKLEIKSSRFNFSVCGFHFG